MLRNNIFSLGYLQEDVVARSSFGMEWRGIGGRGYSHNRHVPQHRVKH